MKLGNAYTFLLAGIYKHPGIHGLGLLDLFKGSENITIHSGNIYTLLGKLCSQGYIEYSTAPGGGNKGGRSRKIYMLTPSGEALLKGYYKELSGLLGKVPQKVL